MNSRSDILQVLSHEDVIGLRDLYQKHFPRTIYVYNLINSALRWKKQRPNENYITVMSPHGIWKNGTVFLVQQFNGYEVFIFTLEKSYEILHEVITTTKIIDWSKRMLVYAVHTDHAPTVRQALKQTVFAYLKDIPCMMWCISAGNALELTIDCPKDAYVAKLKPEHATILAKKWPHTFIGCEGYMRILIEMNGGYGVFLKSSNDLVAWIVRIQFGVGMLHVEEQFKRKGYGTLITKVLSKEIAQEGISPGATVLQDNRAAQVMFERIGYKKLEPVVYIESKEKETIN